MLGQQPEPLILSKEAPECHEFTSTCDAKLIWAKLMGLRSTRIRCGNERHACRNIKSSAQLSMCCC